jgi:hypothetical protein
LVFHTVATPLYPLGILGLRLKRFKTVGFAPTSASDVQDERPAATMFEKLVYYKHGLVMNDAVLMEPIAGVPNADADTNPTASSPVKSRPSTANADGASKEAAAKEHAQVRSWHS